MAKIISVPDESRREVAARKERETILKGTWMCDQCDAVVQVEERDNYTATSDLTRIRMRCPACAERAWFDRPKEVYERMKPKRWFW